jgi:hypothetical protein
LLRRFLIHRLSLCFEFRRSLISPPHRPPTLLKRDLFLELEEVVERKFSGVKVVAGSVQQGALDRFGDDAVRTLPSLHLREGSFKMGD